MERTKVVYLFGDQSVDASNDLIKILSAPQGPIVDAFIKQSLKDLRIAVDSLPYPDRSRVPRFSSFRDLIGEKEKGSLYPAIDQALACVYHLSSFIA